MKIVRWVPEDEIKGSVEEFLKKFDSKTLDGAKDCLLFYKALAEAKILSAESDDEDKQEYSEILDDDIEEYGSLAYFTEIRGHPDAKVLMVLKPDFDLNKTIAVWEGEYEPLEDVKQNVYMEMTKETMEQIMYGNPNTDAQFFAGDLTVKGPLKLATKPRAWIEAFFEFCDREVD